MLKDWEPKTKLGFKVKNGEITNIDEIIDKKMVILEPEIVDLLIPDLETVVMDIKQTQRITDSGRRISYRAVVIVGDKKGHVGLGVGKAKEVKKAIDKATAKAKKSIVKVARGCGSWECKCDLDHSLPYGAKGKESSSIVILKPAPRGVGLVANKTVKEVLRLAGVKDVWSKAQGSTSNIYNVVVATLKALNKITQIAER